MVLTKPGFIAFLSTSTDPGFIPFAFHGLSPYLPNFNYGGFRQFDILEPGPAHHFHLDPTDTTWEDQGTDLSADSGIINIFDIDGQTRTVPWSIGADQYISAVTSRVWVNIMNLKRA